MRGKLLIGVLVVTLIAAFSFTGCGSQDTTGSQKQESSVEDTAEPMPSIDDIQYEMKSGVVDGNRVPVMNITNNSEYDFVEFDVDYKVKEGVTKKQLRKSEDLVEKAKSMDHKLMEITVSGGTEKVVKAGTSVKNQRCFMDGTIEYFRDVKAIDFFEPDILKVSYVAGDKIYTAYYDYAGEEMSLDGDVVDKCTWPDNELAKMIPKPEAEIIAPGYDDEDLFTATVYDADKSEYDAYVKKCREAGFTTVDYKSKNYYYAYHKEKKKVKLELQWYESRDQIYIHVDKM